MLQNERPYLQNAAKIKDYVKGPSSKKCCEFHKKWCKDKSPKNRNVEKSESILHVYFCHRLVLHLVDISHPVESQSLQSQVNHPMSQWSDWPKKWLDGDAPPASISLQAHDLAQGQEETEPYSTVCLLITETLLAVAHPGRFVRSCIQTLQALCGWHLRSYQHRGTGEKWW